MSLEFEHVPVLLEAVLRSMPEKADALVVDGPLGLGGYSEAFLNRAPGWTATSALGHSLPRG